MKKARSNYPCKDVYVQHYIHSKIRNQKDPRIHHTPGHNLYMEEQPDAIREITS